MCAFSFAYWVHRTVIVISHIFLVDFIRYVSSCAAAGDQKFTQVITHAEERNKNIYLFLYAKWRKKR